jgi:uncharacterized membrane protein
VHCFKPFDGSCQRNEVRVVLKIYMVLWGLLGAAAIFIFLTGNLSDLAAAVLSLTAVGLSFMGMTTVVSITLEHSYQNSVKTIKMSDLKTGHKEMALSKVS